MTDEQLVAALAEALHDQNDLCNANYYVPFKECVMQGADTEDATELLAALEKAGWRVVRHGGGTQEMGL